MSRHWDKWSIPMIKQETVAKIFDAIQIEEVIGDFVTLKKAGSNFKGLSPFSEEKTPSFMVSPSKNLWKDFSSGKGGNAVGFLMEHEKYNYPEALRYLAKKYNIEIEETAQSDEEKKAKQAKESLFLVNQYAKDQFKKNLWAHQEGRTIGYGYFKERGFTDETIEKFQLGYSLAGWRAFTDKAMADGHRKEFLVATGLSIFKEDNKHFDRFRARVMFPIHSMSGRVLGFGARILNNQEKAAKYLNSPESDIYHKSKVLYGIYFAKQAIAKEDNCYLVEGYTDVISMHQSGIKNVVASSGTALTPQQIRIIKRLTPNITVLFDGDAAGIRAAMRGIDMILEADMNVKIATFPKGADPDSFVQGRSQKEIESYLEEQTQDFISFKTSFLLDLHKEDPIKKANVVHDIVASINQIPDPIKQELYLRACAKQMDLSEHLVFNAFAQKKHEKTNEYHRQQTVRQNQMTVSNTANSKQALKINQLNIFERELIEILLLYGNKEVVFDDMIYDKEKGKEKKVFYKNKIAEEIFLSLQEDEIVFSNALFKSIYDAMVMQLGETGEIDHQYFTQHAEMNIAETCSNIIMETDKYQIHRWDKKGIYVMDKEDESILKKKTQHALLNLRTVLVRSKIDTLNERLKDSEEDHTEILTTVNNYNKIKKMLSDKLTMVCH